MRQNIIFSTLAVAVAPAAAMATTGQYMKTFEGVQQLPEGTTTVFTSSDVKLPATNGEKLGLRAFYLWYDLPNAIFPDGTKVRIKYGDIVLSEREKGKTLNFEKSHEYPISEPEPHFVVPAEFPERAKLSLEVEIPAGQTGSISGKIFLTTNLKNNNKTYVKEVLLKDFYAKVQQYASSIGSKGYVNSTDDNAALLLFQDLSVEGNEEKTVENYEKYDIFDGTETIEQAFKELKAKIEKAEIDRKIAAAQEAIGDIDAKKQALQDIIDDPKTSEEARKIAQDILDNINSMADKQKDLDKDKNAMTEYDEENTDNVEALTAVQKKGKDIEAQSKYIAWQQKALDVQTAIDEYKALLDELDKTVGKDVTLYGEDEADAGKYKEGGSSLDAYQLLAFRNWMGRLKGKQAALDAFIAKGADNYKDYVDGNATDFTVPENVKGGDWLKDGDGNYITDLTDAAYDGYAWLNGTEAAYVAALKATKKYTDEQIDNKINGLKSSVFGETLQFANIEELLGTEKTPEIDTNGIPKYRTDKSVLGNIAYVNGCAQLYQQKAAQIFDEVIAAKKDYDERMTQLGAKFQEYKYTVGGEEKVVFADNLPWIKEQMYNLIMDGPGETLGILDVKKAVTDAMKDGNPISYETGHNNYGYGLADPNFNEPLQFVPWQLWSNRLLKVLTTDDPNSYAVQYITGWKDKAEQAYTRYTDLKKLVTGTDDKANQLQAMLNDLLPGEGDPAIDATVQAKLANIQTYINGLSAKLDEVVNHIVETEDPNTLNYKDNFEINTEAFDKNGSGAWNDLNYGDAVSDPYHSYKNIKKLIENMSAALTKLAAIDAAAQRLKTASDALDALTPAVAVNDGDPTYTDPAYKASDFYGYKNIDDPTTAADEAAQNVGFAKTITDWLKAARQKLINNDYSSNPNPDYTSDSFTDGEDQNTYPGFYDSNTNILHWSDINNEIMKLETGGDGNGKVNKWKTQLDKIKTDEARIKEIEDQVKNHGIYNYQDPNNGNKSYKDLIDGWRDHIKSFKDSNDWYADSYTNKADDHWTDLDGAEYTSITDFKADTDITADKDAYALIDLRNRVDDLYTDLYGSNGYDAEGAGEKAGYVDTVLGKYAQVKAAYDKWIADNDGNEDAAFGSTANSAKRGNALTLHKIMSETELTGMLKRIQNTTGSEANSDQSTAIQKYQSLPATTAPDYKTKLEEVYDLLLKVKDELDVFYLDLQEGAKQNDITATEGKPNETLDDLDQKPTNLGLLKQLIDDLGNNKLRYDEINNIKGRLANRVESALEELENKKTSLGGTTPEIDALKAVVESDYKPVPDAEELKIQAFYVDCKAKDQGSDKTQIYSNKDPETGKFWVLDKPNDYDQGEGRELEYWILKKTLDNLNKLMTDFNDGYDDMVADNNANTYANSVLPAFNDAMAVFDKAIGILNKFKTPTDDELLDAYKVAFNTFTPAIQTAPNATRAAQKTANDNMEAANDAQKLYDPTNDVAAINAIKADAVTAINNFIEAMQTAAQDRLEAAGGAKELANAAIYEANVKILNGGDPYKFNDVNGAPYVYSEAVYFKDEKDIIADANDKANMIKDNVNAWTDAADGIHEGDFEQFLQFDKLIQDEENGLQSIPASVQVKLNQAAYEDLGNRIKEFEEANVTPIANKFKGGYGEYTEKINLAQFEALKAAGKVEATVDFADFCAEYGYGDEAADGNRYTYEFALGNNFEATKKLFDDLKAATVDEAKNLNKKYYDDNHLPEYDGQDDDGNDVTFQTRQEVLDLLDTFNTADLDESLDADKQEVIDALDNAYQQKVIDNQQYIADYNAFGERLAAEKEGIESLYVGSDFAAQLKALEDDYKAHGSDADIPDLNQQLDQIVKDAKKAETGALTQEIINLKDDYDQMVKEADDKITAFETNNGDDASKWTDEQKAEYAALKATRDDLVKKYTTDDEVEQGETPTKDQQALDIAVNTNTLNGYNTNIDDTNVPFFGVDTSADNDPSYDELKELEGNVSKIKEQIAIDRGDKTAEQIAALADGLLDRWQKVWDAESQYIAGQKLMEPENPLEEGFLGEDFGLNKYYLNADFTDYQENYLKGYIAALNTLKANIEAHADDIMLYFDKFDQSLSVYEQWLLPDAEGKPSKVDNFINCDDADVQADSYFLKSEAQKEMAQKHAVAKAALLEDIKDVWEKLNKAKSDIDGYQLTTIDGDGNEVPVALDYDSYAKKLNQLEVRLNTYYLKRDGKMGDAAFDENVNLNGNKGAKQYKLYLFDENAKQITDEWLAGFAAGEGDNMVTLAQYLDKETGIVELPACDGLTKISNDIAAEVAYYSFMAAQEEFDKAEAAYDEAMTTIGDTEMRYADKMDLYRRMYGTDITNPDETEYEEDEFGNPVLDGDGNPVVAKEDGSFQKLLADLEAVIGDQTPETMDAYKERVEAYIQALNALSIEAKATRVGDIAGGGEDGLQPDGSVDVIDLQRLLNLVNQPSEQKELTTKQFQASDLNNDGYIDIVDLGVMCDIMVGATDYLHEVDPVTGESVFASRQLATTSETLRADVVATDGNSQRIAISLSNERAYTGFQMDITLPEGMRLVGQSLSDRADGQQLYANEWNGKTRLVGFTATKAAFTGNDGAVVYLDVETDESYKGGSVKYDDIIFLTTNAKGVKFQMQGETTGVISRFADAAKETIYNLGGRVMNGLKKGVNILRGNDGAKKVIKK